MNSTKAEEAHVKPFRNHKLESTRVRYSKVWAQLILFCLRIIDAEPEFDGCQLNTQMEHDLRELRAAIQLDTSESDVTQQILHLSVSLITQSDYDKEYSLIKYFAGILGYSITEARWLKPQEYTPVLARILFCMQVIGLEHSLPAAERDTMVITGQNTPETRLNRFRGLWLVENKPSPFNMLHKLLNYGLTAAKDGVGNNWIRIDADEEWLYFKGEKLSIAKLKDFQRIMLRKAEDVLGRSLLFRKNGTVPDIDPYQFVHEDFSNLDSGYYFADVIAGWRDLNRTVILNNLEANASWWDKLVDESASTIEDGMIWRLEGIKAYEKMCNEFLRYMAVVMNMQGGETGRGEEMMSMTYKNTTDRERNLKIESGQVVLETVYHKSQAVMDSLKVRATVSSLTHSPSRDIIPSGRRNYSSRTSTSWFPSESYWIRSCSRRILTYSAEESRSIGR